MTKCNILSGSRLLFVWTRALSHLCVPVGLAEFIPSVLFLIKIWDIIQNISKSSWHWFLSAIIYLVVTKLSDLWGLSGGRFFHQVKKSDNHTQPAHLPLTPLFQEEPWPLLPSHLGAASTGVHSWKPSAHDQSPWQRPCSPCRNHRLLKGEDLLFIVTS